MAERFGTSNAKRVTAREQLRFALKPRSAVTIARHGIGQHFECDVPLQPRVSRSIDFAHAANAKGGEDFIRTDPGAGSEGHEWGEVYRR